MKNIFLKKILTATLAGAMMLSLCACGGSGAPSGSQPAAADPSKPYAGHTLYVANWQGYNSDEDYCEKAFEDASIFYRNLNNGQEFKVVRDKYTRAEIIRALKDIQSALDYYYQVYPQ